ncbi:CHAT domain-containing protein [Nitrososphaera sp.]|uniref:CHAT domain-containing protein n=1 Tax=Nitrososphaera sp. TaxID=1971748 RepID=UPI00307F795C
MSKKRDIVPVLNYRRMAAPYSATSRLDGSRSNAFLRSYIATRQYLKPPSAIPGPGRREDFSYDDEKKLWKDALDNKLPESATVLLKDFKLLEWIPQSPGLYHTEEAAMHILEARGDMIEGTHYFNPRGKEHMVNGGVGCLRLLAKNVGGEQLKFLSATTSGSAHAGFVVALKENTYREAGKIIKKKGMLFCRSLSGKVRFLPRDSPQLFEYRAGIPRMYIVADTFEPADSYSPARNELDVTAAVTFKGKVSGRTGNYWTFSHFDPSRQETLTGCVKWIENDYVRALYSGQVLTDFDEEVTHFADTVLSVRSLMSGPARADTRTESVYELGTTFRVPGELQDEILRLARFVTDERKVRMLFLSANPQGTQPLDLIEECNSVSDMLAAAEHGSLFDFEQRHNASVSALDAYLLRYKPQILHFAGHGTKSGIIVFQDSKKAKEHASIKILSDLFRIWNSDKSVRGQDRIRLVCLNACYSERQARVISESVDCVVGMSAEVSDEAAKAFAGIFYSAVGNGKSVRTAFDLGRNKVARLGIAEEGAPKLLHRPEVDPSAVFLVPFN